MNDNKECQLHCLPEIAEGYVQGDDLSTKNRLKRLFAKPWNYFIKKQAKRLLALATLQSKQEARIEALRNMPKAKLSAGDIVRVRSREEIESTLDRWNELKGCAFLESMWDYCGTTQRVLKPLERFLDERDYKVKKCKGIVLLDGIHCEGTPVFGSCDRMCYLFWRVEWLEKIS